MTLIFNLLICTSAILFFYTWIITRPTKEEKKHEVDHMITKMVGDYWDMIQEIRRAASKAELEAWYYEVEQFDATYSGLVDNKLLQERLQALYEAVMNRRDELNMVRSFS